MIQIFFNPATHLEEAVSRRSQWHQALTAGYYSTRLCYNTCVCTTVTRALRLWIWTQTASTPSGPQGRQVPHHLYLYCPPSKLFIKVVSQKKALCDLCWSTTLTQLQMSQISRVCLWLIAVQKDQISAVWEYACTKAAFKSYLYRAHL